jgi:PAT family acetyl-CoA transporter-like MFS transporter 1
LHFYYRDNVGWASTCNSVGQTAGYFMGNVVFLALESKDFANRYIRQPFNMELQSTGLITLPGKMIHELFETVLVKNVFLLGFLQFWGIIFAISTTLVALLKHETDESYDLNEPHFNLVETYKLLLKVLRLPSIRSMAVILLTVKVRSRISLIGFFFMKSYLDRFCCNRCNDWIRIN